VSKKEAMRREMKLRKWPVVGIISLIAISLLFIYIYLLDIKKTRVVVEEVEIKEEVKEEEKEEEGYEALFSSLGIQRVNPPLEAKDFTLENLTGSKVSLEDFQDKVVFLNFWAIRCPSCRAEMPGMEMLWQVFKDDEFVILAVNLGEGKNKVSSFVQKNDYTFPVLLDSWGRVANIYGIIYGIEGIPITYLLDPEGRIVGRAPGPRNWANQDAFDLIEYLLSKKKTS